ncbi:putative ankyrin repeat protein RBE_0317 isoform X1 [Octopus sinensis]|uniref:Ankyrin repeat protein RBE_0317 isoform X1 n=1 Tax=Octopus sinensis TaxID=2607531 RepID=A0A6P7SP09_9MOLL|nr:putative ankyrin repeat protein RBE_0317 isoform X1 [Octopus sinensis]
MSTGRIELARLLSISLQGYLGTNGQVGWQQSAVEVNVPGIDGHAPLHCACTIGYTETVGLLLNQIGIDANVVNKYGDTPLHWAVQRYFFRN